jgi:diadenosine tetraphosphate (Ap4A) HIT family hydrolase
VADCQFCTLDPARIVAETEQAIAFRDGYPIAPGHTLVIPRLHAASLFDLPGAVQSAVWETVERVRARLADELHPDGFNIGLNDGVAAGQTVMHAHVHVIPRRNGDVRDPRGGVRWVIPDRAAYWSKP